MKAETTKRLFRAIADRSDSDLQALCRKIIAEAEEKGHKQLAKQLRTILDRANSSVSSRAVHSLGDFKAARLLSDTIHDVHGVASKRTRDPLVSLIAREKLRHHMVLPVDVESRFQRIEREFAARDRLAHYGLPYRKRVLIFGPPGCGKTLGAERLAWTTGLPLVKIRFDAMISSYFGESAANLRTVFESTRQAPCLLFLDECDFIARSRDSTNDVGEVARIANTLLQLLDEYDSPGMLLAATNLTQSLDSALFRRFDDVFEIPVPGPAEIKKLLGLTLEQLAWGPELNVESFVDRLAGTSASTIVAIARDAAKSAILEGHTKVSKSDLEAAIQRAFHPHRHSR